MTATEADRDLLKEFLAASNKVAQRLAWSRGRINQSMPLDAAAVDALTDEDEERFDALLYRFNSLTAMIQDHVTRALLKVEEEDVRERSKRDQRLLMEKLGALGAQLNFGTLAELRNRIAHHYPDDNKKQAEILSSVFERSSDLIQAFNDVLIYCDGKHFNNELDLHPVAVGGSANPEP